LLRERRKEESMGKTGGRREGDCIFCFIKIHKPMEEGSDMYLQNVLRETGKVFWAKLSVRCKTYPK
jgi:hypothetical protein